MNLNLLSEYRLSLKELDAEDTLDIFLYRPIAFLIVKTFYTLPITPNHYSFMSLASGITAAIYFSKGTTGSFKLGALYFLLSSVLDNCDGMIARLKKNGTEFGRLIDGLVDYTVNIAVYLSISFGLIKMYPNHSNIIWIFVLLAGASKGIHSFTYDHYLNEYLAYKNGSNDFLTNELYKIRTKIVETRENKGKKLRFFALKLYLIYSLLQSSFQTSTQTFNSKEYCKDNLKRLKLWSFIGPTAHITTLIIATFFNLPFLLLGYSLLFGNLWLFMMLAIQSKSNQELINHKNSRANL